MPSNKKIKGGRTITTKRKRKEKTLLLSEDCRYLLHCLIHCEDRWWDAVPDVNKRNKALNTLIELNLVEVNKELHLCRPTPRGITSNKKALAAGLLKGMFEIPFG